MFLCSHEKELNSVQFQNSFYHALMTSCNVSRFDFSQGHVTKNQPMAIPL